MSQFGYLYRVKCIRMNEDLEKILAELNDEIVLSESSEINEEADANMVSIGIGDKNRNTWNKQDIQNFLSKCADLYRDNNEGAPKQFYSWLDEMADQLRVSAISLSHGRLPFGSKTELCTLEKLSDCIVSGKSGIYDGGVLNVWAKNI